MKDGFALRRHSFGLCVVLVAVLAGASMAQDFASMGSTELVATADTLLKRGDFAGAIPALQEVIVRMKEMSTPQGRETLQKTRYQLARAYIQAGQPEEATKVLATYLENEPRKEERMALRLMAQGYLEQGAWEEVVEYSNQLLRERNLDAQSKMNASLLLGQALFRQEKWEECLGPLGFVAKNAKDEASLNVSRIMMASALVETKRWGELFGLVRSMYRTDTKYDIVLNITLMNAGKALFEGAEEKGLEEGRDDFLNALFLYRMVLPREELIAFSNRQIAELTAQLEKKNKSGIKEMDRVALQAEIDALSESIALLKELPPYEDEVSFRIGQIYAEVNRFWEGYVLFDALYEKDPGSDMGEASVLQTVLILYDIDESDRAEERVVRYLEEQPDGQYVRTMLSVAMRDNLSKEKPANVIRLRPWLDRLSAAPDAGQHLLEADLHYMLAFAYMQAMDFEKAGDRFDVIRENYPESPSYSDAIYFRGLSYMFKGEYVKAYEVFKEYQALGEYEDQYAESVFREGICLFGMDVIDEAEEVMTLFIESFPDNPLVSEAYSLRGDIEAAKDGRDNPDTPDVDEYDPHTLDRALADYRSAIDTFHMPEQAAYAVFQAVKVYELEFKWQEIIDLMNYYLQEVGEKADVAQAAFWIGRAQIELDQVDEAIAAYLETIEAFGNDPKQVGVDKIVLGLVTIANQYLDEDDRQDLAVKVNLKLSYHEESEGVLKLRLRVLKAHLEGEEAVSFLGSELLASDVDFAMTTPISLALLSDAAVLAGDAEQMGLIYDYFLEYFEESDELWHAYRAKTFQLMTEGNYDGVLAIVDTTQGLFGTEDFMGWAQLAKGDALYKLGEYEQAEEAYNSMMGVPQWRGGLYAEAMLGMAQCRMDRADLETAHSYFQRTYLLFKSYDDGKWAADGYLGAAECLARLGRQEDAVNTLDEMLNDVYVNTLPQADTARELKKKYGSA